MSSNLIQTKLLIPPVRTSWVMRPHLVQQLDAGLDRNLILVSAPAGYGKSTLLSEWVHRASLPVAWLSLERSDNTLSRFWAYFAAALQTIPRLRDSHIADGFLDLESVSLSSSPDDALTGLVDKIAGVQSPFILVLDDLHLITDPIIHAGLTFILEHLPPSSNGMHLVAASRQDPPWPLARMRARDQITELRARDLRFTEDEATTFLNVIMGLDLSPMDIAQLDVRTEGWVAGLQMAALSMHNREDIPAFLEKFSGSHRYILDYLIEEVLNQQPPGVMDFLLKTSILDQLSASLCDSVAGRRGSQEILIQLERSNVFLSSIDDEQRWYRYHPLFSDLLQKRLMSVQAGEIPALHARASQWCESNGLLRDAIRHALEADDMKQVARLVSANILILAEGAALPEILEHFRVTQMDDLCARPWLCISVAWAKAYAGQLNEAESLIDKMETALEGKVPEEERNHLSGHVMTIRAYLEWIKGHPQTAVEITQEALEKIPPDDAQEKANILTIQGLSLQNTGRNSEAIQTYREAMDSSLKSGNRYLYIYSESCLVYALKGVGRLHEAIETCKEIEAFVDQSGREFYVQAIGLAAKSDIQRLWNELAESLKSAQQAVALAEKWKQADTLHYTLSVLIDSHLALGHHKEARSLIQRSKWIANNVSDWFLMITEMQEAKLNLACENWDQFLQWRQRRCTGKSLSGSYYPLLARYLLVQKEYAAAIKLLNEGISVLKKDGLWGRTIELYLMRAVAFSALGKKEKALASLRTGLKMAEPEGYVWLFVIQGKPMEELLQQAVKKGVHTNFAQRLLDVMKAESKIKGGKPAGDKVLREEFSDRELEVLHLLNSKLAVPEIANELMVAPSTVRTHVRQIYNKLGAHGRLEAVQKARELGLFKSTQPK